MSVPQERTTMRHEDLSEVYCSVARTWAVIGERWTMLIIREAFRGTRRFDGFQRRLHLGRNLLSNRLSRLTQEGIFERVRYQDAPPRHEYRLTEKGMELYPVLLTLMRWGDRYKVDEPPVRLVHKNCGHIAESEVVCAHCGEPVTYHSVRAEYAPNAW
jgi:DNA-binding HxlR family transcriptional regulator